MSKPSIETETDNKNEKVDVVMSQTSYTRTEAEQLLARHNNDEVAVIRYYLSGSSEKNANANANSNSNSKQLASKNQLVYSEIRKFMDACTKNNDTSSSSSSSSN
jgi:hypothetical protein